MMQNAYNNLKVAIGDAYTPALSEAYGVGTKVLNSITAFIQKNPALVNAITAFAGVIGAVVAALAAYAVAAKIGRYRCRGRNHGGRRCSGHRCGE